MPPPRENPAGNENQSSGLFGSSQQEHVPPLVIVSDRGRHTAASRRIVRAQAARASAAQSRETRARNREDRHSREDVSAPANPTAAPSSHQRFNVGADFANDGDAARPLVQWVRDVIQLSATPAGGAQSNTLAMPTWRVLTGLSTRNLNDDGGSAMAEVRIAGDLFDRQLPIALPKGFVTLRQRFAMTDAFLVLISRTACFDFGSPGVERRLHELIHDLVMRDVEGRDAIHSYLRIACLCLTIFQGQRADGPEFAYDPKYKAGLEAAWLEAGSLDIGGLGHPEAAEASLWALTVISVTAGPYDNFFHRALGKLLDDLQLDQWDQIREVLLRFIYPGSFLDQPCVGLFDRLQAGQR